ncbi:hypothetical protein SH203_01743 [Brevundimonas sp. SH203]|uniref:PH domain-containing protein n=1 Tax=Brevundimonas sp. SH203 TaxID=345167 RepID=UPI0009D1D4C0|nr:PH domain-containing protein [Brevundimonas sp. SH203]GAW41339.1 hypothetical protein SH203_01743 [Brevundimonas sp. SH203]
MTSRYATDRFRSYLASDENVLWAGQPKQGLTVSGKDIFLIPFSLLWGGFAILWNAMVWIMPGGDQGDLWFFRLFGLPFLIVGLYLIVGRFIHDAMIRKTQFYAVTNQRVLMLLDRKQPKLTSLEIRRLPKLELSEHSDGTGSIVFEGNWMTSAIAMNGFGLWAPSLGGSSQFQQISNPRQVYDLIRAQDRLG